MKRWNFLSLELSGAPFQGIAEGREAGKEKAARASSVREEWVSKSWSRDREVSIPVCHSAQKGWIWSLLELLYLCILKLKTIVPCPIYFQEKKGTLKESDKAMMTAFDAIVNFCEELGWVHFFQTPLLMLGKTCPVLPTNCYGWDPACVPEKSLMTPTSELTEMLVLESDQVRGLFNFSGAVFYNILSLMMGWLSCICFCFDSLLQYIIPLLRGKTESHGMEAFRFNVSVNLSVSTLQSACDSHWP